MKIAIFFHRFGPYHHARLKALGKIMETTGIEIAASGGNYAWKKIEGSAGFNRITLLQGAGEDPESSGLFKKIAAQLKAIHPDVIAVPGWGTSWSLFILKWAVAHRTPVIVMSDSQKIDFPRFKIFELFKRQLIRFFDAGLVGGGPHKRYLSELGIPEMNIFMPYDVVDNDYFQNETQKIRKASGKNRSRLRLPARFFLSSFRFVEKKNPFFLLRAFSNYVRESKEPWSLVILGDGPLKLKMKEEIRVLGLGGKVLLPGFKQYGELPSYYGLASVFILPSLSEQWGLVVNEAMASGLPILVSENCGCAEDLVRNGENGYTFNPAGEKDLTAKMTLISGPKSKIKIMGRQSRETIKKWSPEIFALNLKKAAESAISIKGLKRKKILNEILMKLFSLLPDFVFLMSVKNFRSYTRLKYGWHQH